MPTTPQTSAPRVVDARSIITEESFQIDPRLLGRPLARPWRRACAMSVDGILIALLANTPGFLLALAAAVVLFRASASSKSGGYVRRSIRGALRFSAAVILFALVISGWGRVANNFRSPASTAGVSVPPPAAMMAIPGDTEQSGRMMRSDPEGEDAGRRRLDASADSLALAYAAAVEGDDAPAAVELREQLAAATAAAEIAALRSELRRQEARVATLREDRGTPGIMALLRRFAEDLGLGFGWAGLYFTALVALWNGQTVGKRLMRIRVIRLDGKPVGWWMAFERFGGYAASLVTGLLGFAQVLWDRNRQAMHDKIAETVVVREA
jgi:hypothetical protein